MGVLRDLSAAMTFGLSLTTKHKEAETKYSNRRIRHQRLLKEDTHNLVLSRREMFDQMLT